MHQRFIFALSLALTACSDDPKPAEPVANADMAAATPADEAIPTEVATTETVAEPAAKPPVIAVQAMGAKAGTKTDAPAPVPTQAKAKPEAAQPNTFWVFVDGANIRETPSLAGKVVGKLAWSEKVTSLGTKNGFVKFGEGKYVHRSMLTDRKKRFGRDKAAH